MQIMKNASLTLAVLAVGFALAVNGYSQSFLTNGLVAYYPFNGNANDQTTNANNGTPNNALLTADKLNQASSAYAFNGANAFISAPNKGYLTFPSGGDFSVSIWVALDSLPTSVVNPMFFVGMDNGAGDYPKWILGYGPLNLPTAPTGNYVSFITWGGTGVGYALASAEHIPVLGTWHSYLISKAGTNYTLYIDGQIALRATNYMNNHGVLEVGVSGPSAIVSGITAPLTIGWTEGTSFVNGKIDDVRIYNRALSSSEVAQLYAVESGPRVDLIKAVKPSFSNLSLGTIYQLQVSSDLNTWTNQGAAFSATNTGMVYPQYWDVDNWEELFFRLQVAP
jgi:hypothetical protein